MLIPKRHILEHYILFSFKFKANYFPANKTPGTDAYKVEFYPAFKVEIMANLYKHFKTLRRSIHSPNLFCETDLTLI